MNSWHFANKTLATVKVKEHQFVALGISDFYAWNHDPHQFTDLLRQQFKREKPMRYHLLTSTVRIAVHISFTLLEPSWELTSYSITALEFHRIIVSITIRRVSARTQYKRRKRGPEKSTKYEKLCLKTFSQFHEYRKKAKILLSRYTKSNVSTLLSTDFSPHAYRKMWLLNIYDFKKWFTYFSAQESFFLWNVLCKFLLLKMRAMPLFQKKILSTCVKIQNF